MRKNQKVKAWAQHIIANAIYPFRHPLARWSCWRPLKGLRRCWMCGEVRPVFSSRTRIAGKEGGWGNGQCLKCLLIITDYDAAPPNKNLRRGAKYVAEAKRLGVSDCESAALGNTPFAIFGLLGTLRRRVSAALRRPS